MSEEKHFVLGDEAELSLSLLEDFASQVAPICSEGELWTYDDDKGIWKSIEEERLRAHVARWSAANVGACCRAASNSGLSGSMAVLTTMASIPFLTPPPS